MKRLPHSLGSFIRRSVEHVTLPSDLTTEEIDIFRRVEPFTMTSPERVAALCNAVKHVVNNRIAGDVVECGVWRGGSMMAVAICLLASHDTRELHLFDTFEGMPAASSFDKSYRGDSAAEMLTRTKKKAGRNVWCIADQDDVTRNVASTGYDMTHVHLVPGKVEDTIPANAPRTIALLRLDTDWYESTKHELTHLYHRLVSGGVLIIDDYGYWQGARRAVDEFLSDQSPRPLLCRVDNTARIAIKL